ncbi:hypothetical protein C8250_042930 [Streptomyces sp. So13.3]|uniref:hypothetical protein n=1 Tax=Streptomyces sp. So13.3 TaxID=2136173 RepID=UPI001105ED57|nr:hypothetical protein [Streptomyces sp. So13.3]QNA77625.1 hypothetical protein C8250_042930 [Streptomyces sp. So13.3]
MIVKQLDDILKEYVTPAVKPAGFKKKGSTYQLTASSGDSAFLQFHPRRIDPDNVVFEAQWSMVPEPYWQWLNREYLVADIPAPHPSGVLAGSRILPPDAVVYRPETMKVLPVYWAFNDASRTAIGEVMDLTLRTEIVPNIQRLLVRDNLLQAIRTNPSIRRWGATKAELVLTVDDLSIDEFEELLSRIDLNPFIKGQLMAWAEIRQGRN